MMTISLLLHLLGAVIWVGGMFFAYMALRLAAMKTLEPPHRLALWQATFHYFFPWVWLSILALLGSGYYMIVLLGGFKAIGLYVHIMHGLALLMVAVFIYIFFLPYARLTNAVHAKQWPEGGKALARIRAMIAMNLSLGLIIICVVIIGKYSTYLH